jgi:DNA-binding MarR family transcriptional regulator
MAVLGRFGPMTANSVVERTAMDKVRVSRAVARLLARNRVSRRTDPDDRRRAILDLTPEGRLIYGKVVPMVLAVESELLCDLDPAERAVLETVVRKLELRTAKDFAGDDDDEVEI